MGRNGNYSSGMGCWGRERRVLAGEDSQWYSAVCFQEPRDLPRPFWHCA